MKRFEIAGYEVPCVDFLVNVDALPHSNQGVHVRGLSWQGGGKVSSGMVAAARLGAKCAMMGAVGSDEYGRFCLADFQRHGIDVSGMHVREGKSTSLSIVLSDDETDGRSFLYRSGTAQALEPQELDLELLENSQWFYLSHITPVSRIALEHAVKAGARIFWDGDTFSQEIVDHLGFIDAFVGSEFFYQSLFSDGTYEENIKAVCAMGPSVVVFTLGEKGCVGYSREEGYFSLPSFPVSVQDTVGAGDVFHGAFLVGLLRGMSAKESAALATATACIKCTRIGGRAAIPDWDTVQEFLRTGKINYQELDQRVAFYGKKLQV